MTNGNPLIFIHSFEMDYKYKDCTVVRDIVDKISYIDSRVAACDTMKSTMASEFSTLLASPTRMSRVSLAVNAGPVALATVS